MVYYPLAEAYYNDAQQKQISIGLYHNNIIKEKAVAGHYLFPPWGDVWGIGNIRKFTKTNEKERVCELYRVFLRFRRNVIIL